MSRRTSTSKLARSTNGQDIDAPPKLRILATGTLFITHTLTVPTHPSESSIARAHVVHRSRGGPATKVLTLLAALSPSTIQPYLVASLGGNSEAKSLRRELELDGVDTRYCRIWPDAGIPSAWVIHAADTNSRTVINHNPLPDITHEEFLRIIGPTILPESYGRSTSPASSHSHSSSFSGPSSPAPFDWIHFEGRSIKTTMNNMLAVSQLAKARAWRSHAVFSLDVGRKGRQGVEALIPFADVIFLSKSYALSQGAFPTPKAFLLSLSALAPAHALLITHWGQGSAVLSLPTREYFQSSGWVDSEAELERSSQNGYDGRESVLSSSWRTAKSSTTSTSYSSSSASSYTSAASASQASQSTASQYSSTASSSSNSSSAPTARGKNAIDGDAHDSGTETEDDTDHEAAGTYDAFIAGMIYALSRKILPGLPYTPESAAIAEGRVLDEMPKPRWRLDECLRFATELAGRKARRGNWEGLAGEMARAGWFDT